DGAPSPEPSSAPVTPSRDVSSAGPPPSGSAPSGASSTTGTGSAAASCSAAGAAHPRISKAATARKRKNLVFRFNAAASSRGPDPAPPGPPGLPPGRARGFCPRVPLTLLAPGGQSCPTALCKSSLYARSLTPMPDFGSLPLQGGQHRPSRRGDG